MRSMHQGGPPMNPYHRGSPPHFHHPHARERGGQLPEGPPGFGHGLGGQRDPRDFHCREGLPPSPHFADRDREREGDREKGSPRIPRDRERRQPITQGGIDGPVGWLTPKTLLPDPSRYRTCTTPCTSGVGDHRKCKWRNSCFYAHYLLELQHFETFRTRPCASFVQAGRCEFGSTCVFIHSHEPASLDCQEITKKQAAVCRELCGEPVEEEGGEGEEKEGEQAQRKERQENEVGVFGGARTGSSGLVAGGVFRKARGARIFREKKKVVEEEVEGEKEKESEESGTEEERVSSEEKRKSLGAAEQEDIPVAGGEEETDNKGKK
uniref:C3H1-type domain-containing protein n=1 Tax=Chromera velia CCMP2878 TaxID=1169474 RepID=A0A0G4H7G7_9ALVE|eukprot:Cvel_24947.t1-p1 / transcript=Cvel_24947.t1 / gene=Cvel_24947 / organism=Chromera_velia_CCMP2878 / gene_product=hypothetical protein / transcript_product=hypothetical protein / location=Cvel_scaffold2761:14231-15900(-) / protein_length=322 / sequence_SO=supercontig / SO=protein_coding / is_pseudo=false